MKKKKTSILLLIGLLVVLIAGTAVTIQANTGSQPAAGDHPQMQCSPDECPSGERCETPGNCGEGMTHGCDSPSCQPGC